MRRPLAFITAAAILGGCASQARLRAVEVPVSNMERAADFYAALLDEPGRRSNDRHAFGGSTFVLTDASTAPGAGSAVIEIAVGDVRAAHRRAMALPCLYVGPVTDGAFRMRDPFGNWLRLAD